MDTKRKMIDPFVDHQVRDGVISHDLSSYGHDMSLADEFKLFPPIKNGVLNPKDVEVGFIFYINF